MGEKDDLELDDRLADGPIGKRSCTDILCCLLFVAFITLSMFFFSTMSKEGDITKFMRPVDFDGNQCGQLDAENYPFLFFGRLNVSEFLNPLENVVCVRKCPE
jgi:solute carrier family 44 (choline transporter-like protein), member 2/4/5